MATSTHIALPAPYTLRAPTEADIPAILDLIAACDDAEFGEHDTYTASDIQSDWEERDLGRDAWVVTATDGRIVGYALVSDFGHGRLNADGYVHPAHTGRGIGAVLLHLTEARAREMVPNAPEGARVALGNGISGLSASARSLLERAGYTLVRHYWRMGIDLDEAPAAPTWPDGLILRTFEDGRDERAVFEMVEEAFSDHWGHTPRTFERWIARAKRDGFDPTLWFLVEERGELAAVALCRNTPEGGWVGTLGVRRPWRKRGLGMALLRQAFGEFYRRGQRKVVLGVDAQNLTGAVRLYERAGMRVVMRFAMYEKELRSGVDLSVQELAE